MDGWKRLRVCLFNFSINLALPNVIINSLAAELFAPIRENSLLIEKFEIFKSKIKNYNLYQNKLLTGILCEEMRFALQFLDLLLLLFLI